MHMSIVVMINYDSQISDPHNVSQWVLQMAYHTLYVILIVFADKTVIYQRFIKRFHISLLSAAILRKCKHYRICLWTIVKFDYLKP